MVAYCSLEQNYVETIAMVFVIHARRHQPNQYGMFNNAPVCLPGIIRKTNSAYSGSFAEKRLWYQQATPKQIWLLRGGQPLWILMLLRAVDYNLRKCEELVPRRQLFTWYWNYRRHCVLVLDLNSMPDANENCFYPELVGEPRILGPIITFTLIHVTELFVKDSDRLCLPLTS